MNITTPPRPVNVRSFFPTILLLVLCQTASGEDMIQIQRMQSQTIKGMVSAVRVTNARLVHTAQLFPVDGLAGDSQSQCMAVLKELAKLLAEYQSERTDLVKVNAYVRSADVRKVFLKELTKWSSDKMPAVACVATRLPDPKAVIALDAVFVSRSQKAVDIPSRDLIQKKGNSQSWAKASVLPLGDVVYISGQAEPGELAVATRSTLEGLQRTLKHLELDHQHIVQVKCFLQPMTEVATVNRQIEEFFGEATVPPVSHVEWISSSLPIEIEVVAWGPPKEAAETTTYLTPPWMKSSPVFSRLARIHGNDRIYISSLHSAKAGTGEQQVRSVFEELQSILKEAGSDLKHLAKATYYVADEEASQELNRLRPEYYDPLRPPAASKAAVSDVGLAGRSLALDMIAAPASAKPN